jgi:hypothetical protein
VRRFPAGDGDVVEEPDLEVRACLAEHLGYQLQLVVLHPDGGSLVGVPDHGVSEPPVDLPVGIPPGPVEFRRRNHVVIQRPERGVGKALIEEFDVVRAQLDRDQVHASMAEGLDGLVRGAVPAHPRAVGLGHHRSQGGHQAARRPAPAAVAAPVLRGAAVNREPVGHDHEVIQRGSLVAIAARGFSFSCCFGFVTVRSVHWCPLGC